MRRWDSKRGVPTAKRPMHRRPRQHWPPIIMSASRPNSTEKNCSFWRKHAREIIHKTWRRKRRERKVDRYFPRNRIRITLFYLRGSKTRGALTSMTFILNLARRVMIRKEQIAIYWDFQIGDTVYWNKMNMNVSNKGGSSSRQTEKLCSSTLVIGYCDYHTVTGTSYRPVTLFCQCQI